MMCSLYTKMHSNQTNFRAIIYVYILDILFSSNHNIHKSSYGLFFGLQTLYLIDFTIIYRLKGLEPKNKVLTNFYEHCDLTKKYF